RQRSVRQSLGEGLSRNELHDDARHVLEVLDAVDRRDRGMIDGGEQPRLPPEARHARGVLRERLGKHLDRDVPPQASVARPADLSHAALSVRIENLETAQTGSLLQRHGFPRLFHARRKGRNPGASRQNPASGCRNSEAARAYLLQVLQDRRSGAFYGRPLEEGAVGRFRASDRVYAPLQTIARHSHGHPYLCYVVRGRYHERSDAGEVEARPGMVLFHPADAKHSDRFEEAETRLFMLEVPGPWLAGLSVEAF